MGELAIVIETSSGSLSFFGSSGSLEECGGVEVALELFEIGADRESATGHDEPPSSVPVSANRRKGGSCEPRRGRSRVQVDSVLPADWRHPACLSPVYMGRREAESASSLRAATCLHGADSDS